MKSIKKSLEMPMSLWLEVEKICVKEDRSFSQFTRTAIREYLNNKSGDKQKTNTGGLE
jgi:metal-responsive CopG/Arc/MetJ family transcriptional regulator